MPIMKRINDYLSTSFAVLFQGIAAFYHFRSLSWESAATTPLTFALHAFLVVGLGLAAWWDSRVRDETIPKYSSPWLSAIFALANLLQGLWVGWWLALVMWDGKAPHILLIVVFLSVIVWFLLRGGVHVTYIFVLRNRQQAR